MPARDGSTQVRRGTRCSGRGLFCGIRQVDKGEGFPTPLEEPPLFIEHDAFEPWMRLLAADCWRLAVLTGGPVFSGAVAALRPEHFKQMQQAQEYWYQYDVYATTSVVKHWPDSRCCFCKCCLPCTLPRPES